MVEAADADEAMAAVADGHLDAVVLDVMMPGRSGMDVLADLAETHPGLPVLMLTALTDADHIVAALRGGAVDHVTKPFSPEVLVARLEAAVARSRQGEGAGGIRFDFSARTATVDGKSLRLSAHEFDLLAHLHTHSSRVFTRDELMAEAWPAGDDVDVASVTELIRRLRTKLPQREDGGPWIETVSGVGYRFNGAPRTTPRVSATKPT